MISNKIYLGTELKYHLSITATGFDMAADDFEVELTCGKVQKIYKKTDLIISQEGDFYLAIDTTDFPKGGDLYATVTAFVPDADFPDGYRSEIDKQFITKIYKL